MTKADFKGEIYDTQRHMACNSSVAERLRVCGYLNEKANIDYEKQTVQAAFCDLTCTNLGLFSNDRSIAKAIATYKELGFTKFDGISGSPVFNVRAEMLTGMIMRAGLQPDGTATFWYMEIGHILQLISAIYRGLPRVDYVRYP